MKLLDHPKLLRQLLSLLRTPNEISHPSGAHDDLANVVCGALVLAHEAAPRVERARRDAEDGFDEDGVYDSPNLLICRARPLGPRSDDVEEERETGLSARGLDLLEDLKVRALEKGAVTKQYLAWMATALTEREQLDNLRDALRAIEADRFHRTMKGRLERSRGNSYVLHDFMS